MLLSYYYILCRELANPLRYKLEYSLFLTLLQYKTCLYVHNKRLQYFFHVYIRGARTSHVQFFLLLWTMITIAEDFDGWNHDYY